MYFLFLYHLFFLFIEFRSIKSCSRKCIPSGNMELNELNKGESVCVKRCVDKFFKILEVVGQELNDLGMK